MNLTSNMGICVMEGWYRHMLTSELPRNFFWWPRVDYRSYGKDYLWLCFMLWRVM